MVEVLKMILTIVLIIASIILTIIVLMQEGKQDGLGSIAGSTDTYYNKNKSRTMEGTLEKLTKILAVLFFVICIVLNLKWLN